MHLIFLDTETTGLDAQIHKPIDIAFKIVNQDTGQVKATYQSLIRWPKEVWDLVDPLSLEINGYSFEACEKGKEIEQIKEEVIQVFKDLSVERGKFLFVCQNPSFDRAFFNHIVPVYTQELLNLPYHWLDLASMYWVKTIENCKKDNVCLPEEISLSKNTIAESLHLRKEEEPHLAINGVNHLIDCYFGLIFSL